MLIAIASPGGNPRGIWHLVWLFLPGLVPGNSADVGLQPVGEIQSKRLRRPSAMTESSPNAAILDALIEIEIRLQRLFEEQAEQQLILNTILVNMKIFSDREF